MTKGIIVFNAGSSSLKFSLFEIDSLSLIYSGKVDDLLEKPVLTINDHNGRPIYTNTNLKIGYKAALAHITTWIESNSKGILAAGHRIVHGGGRFTEATKIDKKVLTELKSLTPLAPLHQPHNLSAINAFFELHPHLPQIGCFDTAFHSTQNREATLFALPRAYADSGVLRYGFHGLSYEYIASVLPKYLSAKSSGRVIVAHLGNGASMCAMKDGKSVATTMGFTTLDGLMMGTRCGELDPGIVLYLLSERKMSMKDIEDLLYHQSGLKGVSGISHDMRNLLASDKQEAKEAIDLFCYYAAKKLASLIPALGGLDAIVFTAGIGEGSATIRQNICNRLSWLGISLLSENNNRNDICISANTSTISVYVIPTNEELVIACATKKLLYS